jgi:RNA polymerase sigma-70 factor (ECF subfamily)
MRAPRADTIATRASLIGRLKNWDDQTSWQEFDRTYHRLIIAFALTQGLNQQEAEDVAQNTLLAVAKGIGEFEYDPARSSFKNWLLTVTRHRIADHCRRRPKAAHALAQRSDDTTRTSTVARLPDPNNAALEALWDEEWRRTLTEQAMERLKPTVSAQHFQIFYLSVVKEQPATEVAAGLGVSVARVYVVRHRLARRFKKIVAAIQKELG